MKRFVLTTVLGLSALAVCGCGPADVAGSYTVATTNGMNGCGLGGFMPGDTSSGTGFTITQTGAAVSGTVEGLAGAGYSRWLGSNVFTGTVSGTHIDMVLHGTRAMSSNGCAYTYDARAQGDLNGDAIQGTIVFTANTNDTPACDALRTCETVVNFSGTRPPQ